MKVSVQGICAILSHEAIILTTYDDGGGVLTIGAGHTAMAGAPVPVSGMKISLEEAFNIFRCDLEKYEKGVLQAINVPLTQNQFDALVSWHFNTGRINNSTLTNKLNDGDYEAAAKEFARWNKDNGKILRGLVKRRKSETEIFEAADYGNDSIIIRSSKNSKAKNVSPEEIVKLIGGQAKNEEDQTTQELLKNPNSRFLPKFRPRQTAETSVAALEKFNKLIPEGRRDDKVVLLGVRGYYTDTLGKPGQNDRGLYDDAIFVIEPEGVHNFNGNTDPSRYRKGIAKLKSSQAVKYIPGPHGYKRKNGPYPAFRQDSPCTVTRDQKGDDTGIFYINLHRGGVSNTSSAGCQTVPPHQWNEFRTLVNNLLEQHNQNTFYYLLLDVDDIPEAVSSQATGNTSPVNDNNEELNMAEQRDKEILQVVSEILNLTQRIRQLQFKGRATSLLPQNQSQNIPLDDTMERVVNSILLPPTPPMPIEEKHPELTPINAALGTTIGNALDGKKTALGIIGLLATTVIPIFAPQLAPVVEAAKSVVGTGGDPNSFPELTTGQSIIATAKPIFLSLATWGGFGKIEKWVKELEKTTKGQ